MYAEESEAKKRAASATSSGSAKRPTGMVAISAFNCSAGYLFIMSVLIYPGAKALQVIPLVAFSTAVTFVNPINPDFEVAYYPVPKIPMRAVSEDRFTIRPYPCPRIDGSTAFVQMKGPVRLTAMTASQLDRLPL